MKIIVIGGGPAGMLAAIRSGQLGSSVTLIEKNPILGSKLLLSGKGRCNLTNTCDLESFLKRFSGNGDFLRDAFKKFFNQDLIKFFEERGLKLKTERQLRVFPVTDKSSSIVEVLKKEILKNKVNILLKSALKDIVIKDNKVTGVFIEPGKFLSADRVILATGGASYPLTGSSGEGLKIAARLGHTIVRLKAGLVPLETKQNYAQALEGLTLKNIRIKFSDGSREIVSEIGELLFTDFGISGPLVLTLSGRIGDWLAEKKSVYASIDLKPVLSREQLRARILREFKANAKKNLKNTLKSLLPLRMINLFMDMAKIGPHKNVSQITQGEREGLISLLKAFRLDISRTRALAYAMVTRGGVSLKEINPRTMESRKIKGLYFAGEMIDLDADTGGFNLQAAFSTGYLAGESAAG